MIGRSWLAAHSSLLLPKKKKRRKWRLGRLGSPPRFSLHYLSLKLSHAIPHSISLFLSHDLTQPQRPSLSLSDFFWKILSLPIHYTHQPGQPHIFPTLVILSTLCSALSQASLQSCPKNKYRVSPLCVTSWRYDPPYFP